MPPNMNTLVPQASYSFAAPEIWIILQTLGVIAPDAVTPPEFAPHLYEAKTHLLQQGICRTTAQHEVYVTAEIEALVRVTATPEWVIVVNVADSAKLGQFVRLLCFSWTPDLCVVNWVDETTEHHFEAYSPQDSKACVLSYLFRLCNFEVEEATTVSNTPDSQAMAKIMAQADQIVWLLTVRKLQTVEQMTQTLGWFVSERQAWLMHPTVQNELPTIRPATKSDIALAIFELIENQIYGI